ncbi:MAG: NAD-dependent epimerase/dehydratase family protein [Candidatus Omnitrophica bacterium]|nr:NAD-dependent epimerase/dehydratase family protein [Candidatus Omnitrophota bacterium]
MRFLVTGGAGFIGSHIVERLLKDGHFVRVLDNFSSGKPENLSFISGDLVTWCRGNLNTGDLVTWCHGDHFELHAGDIRDSATCLQACTGVDYVLHQAALRSVPKSMTLPHEYNAVNIDGTVNILQAALKSKVKRVVMASSSSIYGDTDKFPQKETDLPLLISPYALTKLAGEYYSRIFSENFGLETVNLRYFNVFGPRQALDDEYAVVIPRFITCMLNDEQPPIHGDGKQSRDFTYVDNVVDANILAATKGTATNGATKGTAPNGATKGTVPNNSTGGTKGTVPNNSTRDCPLGKTFCEVFNVANGKDNTVLELVASLNKIIGKDIKPRFTPIRPGDVLHTLADVAKIKTKLGFKAKFSFEEGLGETVSFWKQKLYSKNTSVNERR